MSTLTYFDYQSEICLRGQVPRCTHVHLNVSSTYDRWMYQLYTEISSRHLDKNGVSTFLQIIKHQVLIPIFA